MKIKMNLSRWIEAGIAVLMILGAIKLAEVVQSIAHHITVKP